MREVGRSVEAAKTRSPAETRTIAVHEAGHAALQIALDLDRRASASRTTRPTSCAWVGWRRGFPGLPAQGERPSLRANR
jgi:hypothetical protein